MRFQVLRGQHRAGGRALVRLPGGSWTRWWPAPPYPGCCRRRRSATSTTSTAASSTRSRSGRAVELGATRVFVLQVGRIDRPLNPAEAPGRSRGSPSRSPAGTGSSASWPSSRTTWSATCCRPGAPRAATTRCSASRDFGRRTARIDATYDAGLDYLEEHLSSRSRRRTPSIPRAGRRRADRTLVWVLLPLWVVARQRRCRRCLPGRWRALRAAWIFILYVTIDALLLL